MRPSLSVVIDDEFDPRVLKLNGRPGLDILGANRRLAAVSSRLDASEPGSGQQLSDTILPTSLFPD